jgi:hypothetical protein
MAYKSGGIGGSKGGPWQKFRLVNEKGPPQILEVSPTPR